MKLYILRSVISSFKIPRNWFICKIHGVDYDKSWQFFGVPVIRTSRQKGKILIGKNFVARSRVSSNSIGVIQPVVLRCGPSGKLTIGDNVGVSGSSICATKLVEIGNHVLIGSGCLITDTDAHPLDPDARRIGDQESIMSMPVFIGDDVFIGARAIILKGVSIGRGSVVGAGSVVTSSVPPFSVVAGNPAKIIHQIKRTSI